MEPKTLLENLNSNYFEAVSALQPQDSSDRVTVYVESDEDIAFWHHILKSYESNNISFDIQLPIRDDFKKGKSAVLKFKENVGTHLILCVDSDYDYLLQQTTETSQWINENPFIFQTYTYSIENYLCYSESLHSLCVQATKNNNPVIDLVELLKLYSKIVYPLFLWSVHFALKEDTTSFSISDFSEIIKILTEGKVDEQFKDEFIELRDRVEAKINQLETQFLDGKIEVESLKNRLGLLGIEKENTYLFIQGHTLKDNVVLMFLKPIERVLKKVKRDEINEIEDGQIKENAHNQFNNQIQSVTSVLNANTEFKSCFLFNKIKEDLGEYVNKFHSTII